MAAKRYPVQCGEVMRIELDKLEHGRGEFALTYNPDQFDLSDERVKLAAPAVVSGKVRLGGHDVLVSGNIQTRVEVDCDRCLKPVELPVNTDFTLEYITNTEYEASTNVELTSDELSVSTFDGESLDVDEIVKEQVLLAVPSRTVCRDECKGMCPTCGTDRNLTNCNCETAEGDPRWDALKNLKL